LVTIGGWVGGSILEFIAVIAWRSLCYVRSGTD
jgi:hypothetical protein